MPCAQARKRSSVRRTMRTSVAESGDPAIATAQGRGHCLPRHAWRGPGAVGRPARRQGRTLYDKALEEGLAPVTRASLERLALDVFARARRVDPTSVGAHYTPAWFLMSSKRSLEAYPLLAKAAELSPSPKVQLRLLARSGEQLEAGHRGKAGRPYGQHGSLCGAPWRLSLYVQHRTRKARRLGLTAWRQKLQDRLDRSRRASASGSGHDVVSEVVHMDRIDDLSQRVGAEQGGDRIQVAAYRSALSEFIAETEASRSSAPRAGVHHAVLFRARRRFGPVARAAPGGRTDEGTGEGTAGSRPCRGRDCARR